MSFNGSGTFSPYTPGNPVVTGTVISSTAFNATMTDLAAGLTNAITRDGQSPPSANLPMGGKKLTGLSAGVVAGDSLRFEQLFSQGTPAALPSAATVDIGGVNSVAVEISGTTTITSFGTNYNGPRFLRFTGVLILTNSATLSLPGAANITTVAGDTCIAYPNLAVSGWNVVSYTRASGAALVVAAAVTSPSVRQTVLSGPVDTSGQSAFVGATGSTTVTATGTLVMTAANDILNRQGTKVNPSWTGLSTNGTMYLYADVNADGTITEGVGTLAPIYQWGGTPAITSGLFTFNIQEMKGYIGTGAVATAGYRVYVGEVTVAAGVVTAIVWYALMGRYVGADTAIPGLSTRTAFSAKLGTTLVDATAYLRNVTAEFNFTAGMVVKAQIFGNASWGGGDQVAIEDRVTLSTVTGPVGTGFSIFNRTSGVFQQPTAASWLQFVVAKRSW